jgi:hypothetical protein
MILGLEAVSTLNDKKITYFHHLNFLSRKGGMTGMAVTDSASVA